MAVDSFVNMKGLKELDAILKNELPRAAGNRALNAAMTAGAAVVRDEARRRVHVDTGRLKKAIYTFKIRSSQTEHSASRAVSVRNKSRKDPRSAYYWWWVEFGTRFQRARPFLRPALKAAAGRATEAVRDRLLERVVVETVKRVRPKTPR